MDHITLGLTADTLSQPAIPSTTWGIESEVKLQPLPGADIVAEINTTVEVVVKFLDIADNSNVSGSTVDYIVDYGGANISIGSAVTGADGNATLTWLVTGVDPGRYVLRMQVADDVTRLQRHHQQQGIMGISLNLTSQYKFRQVSELIRYRLQ